MASTTLHISLPEELERYVHDRVIADAYSDPSDFVRALIRADRKRQAMERLEGLLLDGLDSGDGVPLDDSEWASIGDEVEAGIAANTARSA